MLAQPLLQTNIEMNMLKGNAGFVFRTKGKGV